MKVNCHFSLYPLRQQEIGEILAEAVRELDQVGVAYRVGSMGTEMEGEDDQVFRALHRAFEQVARRSEAVLVATVSNACGD